MAEVWQETKTKIIVLGLVLVFCSLGGFWIYESRLQQAPDIALQLIDGRSIDLHDVSTGPLLVTFWATTCQTCVKKTPELKAMYQKLNPLGFELVAVAMAYDPPNRILAFSEDYELPYPVALDLDGSIARAFNDVSLTPTTFLISPQKKIIMSASGNLDINALEKKIAKILENPGSSPVNETS